MANSLVDYLVGLGVNIDENGFRRFEYYAGRANLSVIDLANAAVGASFAITGMVEKVAREFTNLYFISQRSNTPIMALANFGDAATSAGLSAEQAIGTIDQMMKLLQTDPGKEGLIRALGVQTRDAQGRWNDGRKILDQLIVSLQKYPLMLRQMFAAEMGISYEVLRNYENNRPRLLQAEAEMKRMMDVAQLKPEDKEWQRFWDQLNFTTQQWKVLTQEIGQQFLPTSIKVLETIEEIGASLVKADVDSKGWVSTLFMLGTGGLSVVLTRLIAVHGVIGGIGTAIQGVAGLMARLNPLFAFLYTMWPKEANSPEVERDLANPEARQFYPKRVVEEWEKRQRRKEAVETQGFMTRQEKIDYMLRRAREEGATDYQAAAFVGNAITESNLDENAVNKTSGAKGTFQWLGDRKKEAEGGFKQQIENAIREAKERGDWTKLLQTRGVEEAARSWETNFERSGGALMGQRIENSREIANHFTTNIHVTGATQPQQTADAIAERQRSINAENIRQLQGSFR